MYITINRIYIYTFFRVRLTLIICSVRVCYFYILYYILSRGIQCNDICMYMYIYIYIYICMCIYRYISTLYIYVYVVYLYITLGTNNAYKNINLGRQTFNYKSVSLEILTNTTITVADFIYNTEIIGKPPSASL